jgi:dihydrolipoamide dehydrogenase
MAFEPTYDYDLAVIGSGPGGYVAAIHAARQGLRTALIEKDTLGGTCLNRGCIPTKAMLHSGEVLETVRRAHEFGITRTEPGFDLDKVYAYREKTVRKLRSGVKGLLKYHGAEIITAAGTLTDNHTISCLGKETEQTITAGKIIVATGSEPSVPPIPGLEQIDYWTSDTLLLESLEMPESITIIGGGVIGVESALIFHDFGVKVTIVEMMPQLLPRMDSEIAEILKKDFRKKGMEIFTGAAVNTVTPAGSGSGVTCRITIGEEEKVIQSDRLFIAVGRKPVTADIGLEAAGVPTQKGCIPVNDHQQTMVPDIYAIGDVTGGWMLAHAATAHALIAVDHILGKKNYINRQIIPSCIYTRPEIGSVGLTAEEAEARGFKVLEGYFPMKAASKAVIIGETEGFVKLVTDKNSGALLGAHLMSPRATDIIAEMALAIAAELTIEEVFSTVHPHPTISETVMEAAHAVEGFAVHTIGSSRPGKTGE